MSTRGCGLNIDKLKRCKSIKAVFPLQDTKERREDLYNDWCAAWKWPWTHSKFTVHRIQQYCGPQLGIYNACT